MFTLMKEMFNLYACALWSCFHFDSKIHKFDSDVGYRVVFYLYLLNQKRIIGVHATFSSWRSHRCLSVPDEKRTAQTHN